MLYWYGIEADFVSSTSGRVFCVYPLGIRKEVASAIGLEVVCWLSGGESTTHSPPSPSFASCGAPCPAPPRIDYLICSACAEN